MKFLKAVLKYIGYSLLGVVVSTLVGATIISYLAVEHLADTKTPPPSQIPAEVPNHNLREVTRLTKTYIAEVEEYEKLMAQLSKQTVPEFCSTLCNPSGLDREMLREQRTHYLAKYYQQQGPSVLKDPLFRLKLEEMQFISKAFPESVRDLIEGITDSANEKNRVQAFLEVLKFEATLVTEANRYRTTYQSLLLEDKKLKELRRIVNSCNSGSSLKTLREECRKVL